MTRKVKDLFDLTGKTAMVTGGCQNFGEDIAAGLLEAGAEVIITSRDPDKAAARVREMSGPYPGRIRAMSMDLRSEESVVALFAEIRSRSGRLDILVNNAGGHSPLSTGFLETEPLEAWNTYMEINLTGTFLMLREYARLMIPLQCGCVINIASIAAAVGRDRRIYPDGMKVQPVHYAAAKAGVVGLTYDAAASLGHHGIRVNAVSPGGFERGQPEAFISAYSEKTMLRRMGRQGMDLKGVVAFLASDAANYITGQNIFVDGGFTHFK